MNDLWLDDQLIMKPTRNLFERGAIGIDNQAASLGNAQHCYARCGAHQIRGNALVNFLSTNGDYETAQWLLLDGSI